MQSRPFNKGAKTRSITTAVTAPKPEKPSPHSPFSATTWTQTGFSSMPGTALSLWENSGYLLRGRLRGADILQAGRLAFDFG